MKPRVLHVIPFLWSGAGNVVSRLCLSQRADWNVAIVTSGRSRGQRDWPAYRKSLAAGGVDHHQIDFFDRTPETFWRGVDSLARLISTWHPDVVHTHAGVPACAAAAVRGQTGHHFRLVNHVYNWGVGRPEWMNSMDLSGIRRADRVVCSAGAYTDLLLRGGVPARRLAYIPWGLDLETIRSKATQPHAARTSGPRIGFVGRIEPRKGQLALVRGFARYLRNTPKATLEIVGPVADAEYASEIDATICRHGLQRHVTLAGHVRNPYRHLSTWDLFVSLASDEGQGLALLEAMALGVPVLARRIAGIEDYLEEGVTGWACPSVSAPSVANAMRRALTDPQQTRIVARARQMVDRRYGWARTVDAIQRLYER